MSACSAHAGIGWTDSTTSGLPPGAFGIAAASIRGASVTRLCPSLQAMLTSSDTEGVPPAAQLDIDRRRAEDVRRSDAANIRDLYPYVTALRVGPGWGRGWRDTPTGTVVTTHVRDFAVIAAVRAPTDCPASEAFGSMDGVPIFFAVHLRCARGLDFGNGLRHRERDGGNLSGPAERRYVERWDSGGWPWSLRPNCSRSLRRCAQRSRLSCCSGRAALSRSPCHRPGCHDIRRTEDPSRGEM